MNKEFYISNRKKVIESMEKDSILVMFAGTAPQKSADEDYPFTPNRNFYYLTGINRDKMILLVSKKQDDAREILFIEKANPQLEKWIGKRMRSEEAEEVSGIQEIQYLDSFNSVLNNMIYGYNYDNMYLNLERIDYDMPQNVTEKFAQEVSKKYPQIRVKNIYHKICELRTIKSNEEVDVIRKAIDITYNGIMNMMKNAKPGMMEYEIEAYFDYTLKSNGIKDYAFKTITAAGVNGTVLHYTTNDTRTEDGDLVLLDLGAQLDYYNADISFTFPVNGKFTDRQKVIYNIVLKALKDTEKSIKAGMTFRELNEVAKSILASECKKIGLIKEDAELFNYYFHSISHPLGLDTHDVGSRDMIIQPGMVITIEPGLYIPEEEIGIRIEDDVLVTENGSEVLSKDIIRSVEEIENFMKK